MGAFVDDIDHLGNRRVRTVGELLEGQFRVGLTRMSRTVRERIAMLNDLESHTPHDLINTKAVMGAIREFFAGSQLCQFMDQTNPLSEVTNKRRISALGPGGLSREHAGFEVRDVHPSHYGRICPIETPEGQNIGLINSYSCYTRLNKMGFLESPYRKVESGRVMEHVKIVSVGESKEKLGTIVLRHEYEAICKKLGDKKRHPDVDPYAFYLSANEEDRFIIAQANAEVIDDGGLVKDQINARHMGEFKLFPKEMLQYMDVSPKQVVSAAASLIPFLENDDANRALMGSNMQRQAVPLLISDSPIVGTGMEGVMARDSRAVIVAQNDGIVDSVDARRIVIRITPPEGESSQKAGEELGVEIHELLKFRRTNQNTCFNQKPLVTIGQKIAAGDVIADGACTQGGELALGQNVVVAFMPWRGYNFEDAILISQRLVADDIYTSIHIEEFEIEARETKLGPEEITADIPGKPAELLRDLDRSGVIRVGAQVKRGSVLVGKVTPKGETQLTAEEKLLRAIFGDKARDVKDASLTCPSGVEGTVIDVKIFTRKGVDLDERAQEIVADEKRRLKKNFDDQVRIIQQQTWKSWEHLLDGELLNLDLFHPRLRKLLVRQGEPISIEILRSLEPEDFRMLELGDLDLQRQIQDIFRRSETQIHVAEKIYHEEIEKYDRGDELQAGILKMVKLYVAVKRKIKVGDKMAGRHGNKGVVSKVVPEEDMPYLPDGSPVDIILNPLGVPSRMNIGQILETHLGYAGKMLNLKFACPVFEGASSAEIKSYLKQASLHESGKTDLYDGLTGDKFEQPVTVGVIYMLKLHHLVDSKIHARSIGPYSLITQQPLGGKAQFGGQRFGEMEVWALEAYGAAHTLQEMLTVKSDNVVGRTAVYESIVKKDPFVTPGIPESFNVLLNEIKGLCLDMQWLDEDQMKEQIHLQETRMESVAMIKKKTKAEEKKEKSLDKKGGDNE